MFEDQKIDIFLGPRPGKKSLKRLQDLNLTHCCTLLSEREEAPLIGKLCNKIGCEWVWLPIEGGNLELLSQVDLAGHMQTLLQTIKDEPNPKVYFHCSAGIHRTGFFVYSLLRLMGHTAEEARSHLAQLRDVTANQVGQERLDLAEDMIAYL